MNPDPKPPRRPSRVLENRLMDYLMDVGSASVSDITIYLRTSPGGVSRILKRLEAQGLVARTLVHTKKGYYGPERGFFSLGYKEMRWYMRRTSKVKLDPIPA